MVKARENAPAARERLPGGLSGAGSLAGPRPCPRAGGEARRRTGGTAASMQRPPEGSPILGNPSPWGTHPPSVSTHRTREGWFDARKMEQERRQAASAVAGLLGDLPRRSASAPARTLSGRSGISLTRT